MRNLRDKVARAFQRLVWAAALALAVMPSLAVCSSALPCSAHAVTSISVEPPWTSVERADQSEIQLLINSDADTIPTVLAGSGLPLWRLGFSSLDPAVRGLLPPPRNREPATGKKTTDRPLVAATTRVWGRNSQQCREAHLSMSE